MIKPTYPGVYVVEKTSGVRTITGVATSIAAFLGRASKGPINRAVRLLSYGDYARDFGDPLDGSDLADSVRLFFTNGGTDAYVIRLANGATKASVTLQDLNDRDVLVATAKAEGVWANSVRLEVDYNTSRPDDTFNLRVIQMDGERVVASEDHKKLSMDPTSPRFAPAFVSQSSDLIDLKLDSGMGDPDDPVTFPSSDIMDLTNGIDGFSQSRFPATITDHKTTFNSLIHPNPPSQPRSKFEISVNDSPFAEVDLNPSDDQWTATTESKILAKISKETNDALHQVTATDDVTVTFTKTKAPVHNLLTFTAAGTGAKSRVRIRPAATGDIAGPLMSGVRQGGIEVSQWSNFRPAPTATLFLLGDVAEGTVPDAATDRINQVAILNQGDLTKITIDGQDTTVDVVTDPKDDATKKWFESASRNRDGVREKLSIIASAINAEATKNPKLKFRAEVWGYHLALVSTDQSIDARPKTIVATQTKAEMLFGKAGSSTGWALKASEIVTVRQYALGTANEFGPAFYVASHVDGDDGDAPQPGDYLGDMNAQTGFHALDPVDLFNLMILPGDKDVPQTTLDAAIGPAGNYCKSRRAFLLIDPPLGTWTQNNRPQVVQDTGLVDNLRNLLGSAQDHAAVFYPRLRIATNGLTRDIGPAGAIAGLMARVDTQRGVWKAPAGTEATLNGLIDLELALTDRENGVLNQKATNCLRIFPQGMVSWGARTLAGTDDAQTEWKYIPIRRLALYIEESLYRGTKWVVFEPNDEPLWAKIRLNVGAFMMRMFRQGAFQGTSPADAYFVKCDAETTRQADRDLGIVNIVVGFAPLKPAEFVIVTIQQIAGDL